MFNYVSGKVTLKAVPRLIWRHSNGMALRWAHNSQHNTNIKDMCSSSEHHGMDRPQRHELEFSKKILNEKRELLDRLAKQERESWDLHVIDNHEITKEFLDRDRKMYKQHLDQEEGFFKQEYLVPARAEHLKVYLASVGTF
jgi:hypothetical protein